MRRCSDDESDPLDPKRLVVRCRVRLSHPTAKRLERFMRGELPWNETLTIVRHLLTGCPQCVAVTRELWPLGNRLNAVKPLH